MESISIILAFIFFILSGIFVINRGSTNSKNSKKYFLFGGTLILAPFLIITLYFTLQSNFESRLMGDFTIENTNEIVLKLNQDNSFNITNCNKFKKCGKGKWKVIRSDWLILELRFKSDYIYFEIENSDNLRSVEKINGKKLTLVKSNQ